MAKRRMCKKPLANITVGKKEWTCCGGKRAPRCMLVRAPKAPKAPRAAPRPSGRQPGDIWSPPSAAALEKELRYAEKKGGLCSPATIERAQRKLATGTPAEQHRARVVMNKVKAKCSI